jgi:hypothetical protein
MLASGILCFYENTPMGCLKLDCTFVHSRPRAHINSSARVRCKTMRSNCIDISTKDICVYLVVFVFLATMTNLVNKDAIKPVTGTPSVTSPPIVSQENACESHNHQTSNALSSMLA